MTEGEHVFAIRASWLWNNSLGTSDICKHHILKDKVGVVLTSLQLNLITNKAPAETMILYYKKILSMNPQPCEIYVYVFKINAKT